MRELAVQLTDQQRLLVHLLVNQGKGTEEAGRLCGYAKGSVYSAIKRPAVAAAISEAIHFELHSVMAPMAVNIAKTLMKDEAVSARVRADLSVKVLDRAGFIVPSSKQKAPDKIISEMTQAELFAFIERNQAEIDKFESELADRAIDVSAPVSAPKAQAIDANPLNYLD